MRAQERAAVVGRWLRGVGEPLPRRTVIVSPHLDDGIFSLGAAAARAARGGGRVTVLTVLAGNPESDEPAGPWDTRAGFRTAGEAARLRREEDRRACALVGAEPRWLPFPDHQYEPVGDERIAAALEPALRDADAVLLPGYPLMHEDHVRVAAIAGALDLAGVPVGAYLEQPYGTWRPPPSPEDGWTPAQAGPRERVAKTRASAAYRSQVKLFTRPLRRINRYEVARGGELIRW